MFALHTYLTIVQVAGTALPTVFCPSLHVMDAMPARFHTVLRVAV